MSVPHKETILDIAREMLRQATTGGGGGACKGDGSCGRAGSCKGDGSCHKQGPPRAKGNLISQAEVREAKAAGHAVLIVTPGTIVTPLARDAAADSGVELRYEDPSKRSSAPSPKDEPAGGPAPARGGRFGLGADHGGFELKETIKQHLESRGLAVEDLGTYDKRSCDYPDFALAVGKAVAMGDCDWGILVDGAGIGSCMAASKVPGVLAATCHDERTAKNSREHNGANVLCLGSGTLNGPAAIKVVDAWVDMPFAGGRHGRRVDKIRAIERGFVR